jgi:hypothetical protein
MSCWTQTSGCLLALACAACAGTIDDPAAFEAYAAEARGGGRGSAGVAPLAPELDAGGAEPDPQVEEEDAAIGPAPVQPVEPAADAGGSADAALPAPIASSCDFKGLMMSKCGAASCHGGPSASTGLDLTSDGLRARLANVNGGGACNDKPLIDEDNPEQSTLYLIVTSSACGLRMPLGGTLSAKEQECVLEWISAAP